MTREEAIALVTGFEWMPVVNVLRLENITRGTYDQLKEAFGILKMGYDADTIGLTKKQAEKFINFNTYSSQFQRNGLTPKTKEKVDVQMAQQTTT